MDNMVVCDRRSLRYKYLKITKQFNWLTPSTLLVDLWLIQVAELMNVIGDAESTMRQRCLPNSRSRKI